MLVAIATCVTSSSSGALAAEKHGGKGSVSGSGGSGSGGSGAAGHGRPAPAGSSGTPEDPARERSRAAFRRGVVQLRAQDWGQARASFEEAWTQFPHPSILLNLGIARLRTDEPVRAEQDFVRFLSEDFGATPEELAAAREALAEVRGKLGTLQVTVAPASARVQVDEITVETTRRGDRAGTAVAEVRAKPGPHRVDVSADGHVATTREAAVVAREDARVTIELAPVAVVVVAPPAEPPRLRSIVGWSLAGLSGASLVGAGACALHAKSLSDDYADRASSGFQQADVRSEGTTFRTVADVALGVAVVAGVAAVVLLATDLGAPSRRPTDQRRVTHVLRW